MPPKQLVVNKYRSDDSTHASHRKQIDISDVTVCILKPCDTLRQQETSAPHRFGGCCIDSLTWSRSGAAGREGGSSGVCTPPTGQRRRPGKWWPTPQWPRSPPSPWWPCLPWRPQAATCCRGERESNQGRLIVPGSTMDGRSSVEGENNWHYERDWGNNKPERRGIVITPKGIFSRNFHFSRNTMHFWASMDQRCGSLLSASKCGTHTAHV